MVRRAVQKKKIKKKAAVAIKADVIKAKKNPEKPKIPAIKKFIDFFNAASLKIRKIKPAFTHGKDGALVKYALKKLTLSQMEQLTLWFLEKKKTLSPTIGAMLSKKVLETLKKDMERSDFFKEVNALYDAYYSSAGYSSALAEKFRPFTFRQICEIQEQAARLERQGRWQ